MSIESEPTLESGAVDIPIQDAALTQLCHPKSSTPVHEGNREMGRLTFNGYVSSATRGWVWVEAIFGFISTRPIE